MDIFNFSLAGNYCVASMYNFSPSTEEGLILSAYGFNANATVLGSAFISIAICCDIKMLRGLFLCSMTVAVFISRLFNSLSVYRLSFVGR